MEAQSDPVSRGVHHSTSLVSRSSPWLANNSLDQASHSLPWVKAKEITQKERKSCFPSQRRQAPASPYHQDLDHITLGVDGHQSCASEHNPLLSTRSPSFSTDVRPFLFLEQRVILFVCFCVFSSFLSL